MEYNKNPKIVLYATSRSKTSGGQPSDLTVASVTSMKGGQGCPGTVGKAQMRPVECNPQRWPTLGGLIYNGESPARAKPPWEWGWLS